MIRNLNGGGDGPNVYMDRDSTPAGVAPSGERKPRAKRLRTRHQVAAALDDTGKREVRVGSIICYDSETIGRVLVVMEGKLLFRAYSLSGHGVGDGPVMYADCSGVTVVDDGPTAESDPLVSEAHRLLVDFVRLSYGFDRLFAETPEGQEDGVTEPKITALLKQIRPLVEEMANHYISLKVVNEVSAK